MWRGRAFLCAERHQDRRALPRFAGEPAPDSPVGIRSGGVPSVQGWGNGRCQRIERAVSGEARRICGMIPGMDAPRCPLCDRPATIEQPDGPRCADHATNRTALKARLHALGAATLSADPAERDRALAEADAIEYRIGELEVGA